MCLTPTIQKIPDWTSILKKLWDQQPRALKIVVTGSSALLMEKGLKESLAGRFELIRAEHWNYAEAKKILNMSTSQFIEFGCYPGSIPLLRQNPTRWAQYIRDSIVEPAIGRDLLSLHPVEQPALLRQIFGVAVSLPAQIVSLGKIQGQLQGKGTLPTISHYLHLLEKAFLVSGVEKYSRSTFRTKKSSPKLIVHDNSLIRSFEKPVDSPVSSERLGHYLENCVGARFIEAGWETFYWKDRQLDVDFVVIGPNNEKWAIEVKSTRVNPKDLKGVFTFCNRYPEFKPILISLENQQMDGMVNCDLSQILSLHKSY